jgi:hypothetical protein
MKEAKQMTTAQSVGAASRTVGGFSTAVRIGSNPVSSRPYSFRFETGRVLVFLWGRFWVLKPDDGNPSSPVLRGLGASNGAGHSTVIPRNSPPRPITSNFPMRGRLPPSNWADPFSGHPSFRRS